MYPIGESVALSTTMSGPIRVLANNDVPSGAAFIPLMLETHERWEGWRTSIDVQPRLPDGMQTDDQPDFSVSLSSMDTDANNTTTTTTHGSGELPSQTSSLRSCQIRRALDNMMSPICVWWTVKRHGKRSLRLRKASPRMWHVCPAKDESLRLFLWTTIQYLGGISMLRMPVMSTHTLALTCPQVEGTVHFQEPLGRSLFYSSLIEAVHAAFAEKNQ